MIDDRPTRAHRVPTLTEVLELDASAVVARASARSAAPAIDADALGAEVLFELERHIHTHFESRLREAMAPALARVAEGLIAESRQQLSAALGALVEDAVTRALERRTHL